MEPDHRLYEYQVCKHYQDTFGAITWHWSNAPVEELIASGCVLSASSLRRLRLEGRTPQEYGLDGLAKKEDGSYVGVQAKKRIYLHPEDLGSFYSACKRLQFRNTTSSGHLFYTGSLSSHLRDEIRVGMWDHFGVHFTKLPYQPLNVPSFVIQEDRDETTFELYVHQQDAIQSLEKWEGGMTILHMPCGTGKTMVFGTHARKYRHIIVLSPYRIHAQQTLKRLEKFLPNHKALLVDSDTEGTRDMNEINTALEVPCLLSATFRSADVLLECIPDDWDDYLLIVDEAHKLSYEENAVKLAEKLEARCLLVSATPPTSIGGYEDIPVIYSMNIREAIYQGYITDYQVILPTVSSKEDNELVELKDLDEYYRPRVQFMMAAMIRFGLRRCIAYLPTVASCERFLDTCQRVAKEYHGYGFWGRQITNETRNREQILREFQEGNEMMIRVVASVRILDEAIDVVRCDSVFFTEVPTTKSSDQGLRVAIQRICRANRKDPKNPNKVAHALVWADENHMIPNFLGMLKEEDPEFGKHVKRIRRSYHTIGERESMEEEQTETEEMGKYLANVKVYDYRKIIDMKVDLLIREYPIEKPKQETKQYEMSDGSSISLDLGRFWDMIKEKFISDGKPLTTLTKEQKERIKTLPWVSAAIDELLQKRETRVDISVADKVDLLIREYPMERPKRETKQYEMSDGRSISLDLGIFWKSIKENFIENEKIHTRLTEEQKERIQKLPWISVAIDELLQTRETRVNISVTEKVDLLIREYTLEKPKRETKQYEMSDGNSISLDFGRFWDMIQLNFISDEKPNTRLTEEQQERIKRLSWVSAAIDELLQKRETRVNISVAEKVDLLIREYPMERPKQKTKQYDMSDGNSISLDFGRFWDKIKENFISDGKPHTRLTEEQQERIKRLSWVSSAIEKLLQTREKRSHKQTDA